MSAIGTSNGIGLSATAFAARRHNAGRCGARHPVTRTPNVFYTARRLSAKTAGAFRPVDGAYLREN
ncbi:MAG: hypothetical protein DWI68_01435 [Chloroflexi bacterium]|nr:MAG: hypothetical protein DWI68_01435 [Chloroflexota bacterium]